MIFRPLRYYDWIDKHLPPGTSVRKVTEILSIVLVVEGLSVLFLFSYVGSLIGLVSLVLGLLLLLAFRRKGESAPSDTDTPGVRLVDRFYNTVGGEYAMVFLGASVIFAVLAYNRLFSMNPEIGDSDTLSIFFGLMIMLYPLARNRFRMEASFALIFVGCVVAILVIPQAVMSFLGGSGESSVGNWYVHYMLAAPFASILDLVGIPSSSMGNLVTIQFQDGSIHTLSISAYCAGLYSFSIFLSAFVAFVLVFERLRRRVLMAVLVVGLIAAFIGNLFRMVVIGVVGYYEGLNALHWTHENAGWVIFLAWSSLFWWLTLNYVSGHEGEMEAESIEAN